MSQHWIDTDDGVKQTLLLAHGERERQIALEQAGISMIRPVALPRGAYLAGSNHHLGWPVSIMAGRTLLCAYHALPHHHWMSTAQPDAYTSHAVIVRSIDGGHTWSDPVDIRTAGINNEPMVTGFGNCFGVKDGTVFFVSCYGVYRSDDEGQTWILLQGALTQRQTGFPACENFGPRLVIHPTRGLVLPVHAIEQPWTYLFWSADDGLTWQYEQYTLSDQIHPVEPTAFYHDGHLIYLSRNHTLPFRGHCELYEAQHPCMMVSETGWFPMTHQALTNISSYRWPDTTDIDFNTVTHRYEAVVTNRSGGGVPGCERNEHEEQTVNLWSLSPENLHAGHADRWRYEGTLLRLRSGMQSHDPDDIDAAHPGGAVMDIERGVQYITIYAGRFDYPSGIYLITRTLATEKLRVAMQP